MKKTTSQKIWNPLIFHLKSNKHITNTIINSKKHEIQIKFDQPFIIIKKQINPTKHKLLTNKMTSKNYNQIKKDTLTQIKTKTHILNINADIPLTNEPTILSNTMKLIQSLTNIPLSIDSSIITTLETKLKVYQKKTLLNSITNKKKHLKTILPLIKKFKYTIITISNNKTKISKNPNVHFEITKKIIHHTDDHKIPKTDIIIDPLIIPIGTISTTKTQIIQLIHKLKKKLKINTTYNTSNISFNLPNHDNINTTYLNMAITSKLTSTITNPLHPSILQTIMKTNIILNHNPNYRNWIRKYQKTTKKKSSVKNHQERRQTHLNRSTWNHWIFSYL